MNQRSQRELLFENVQTADRSGKSLTDSVCFMSLADRCQCVIKSWLMQERLKLNG